MREPQGNTSGHSKPCKITLPALLLQQRRGEEQKRQAEENIDNITRLPPSAAEISVDTRTGEVMVHQVITANDVGTCLNPLGLQGQVEGGIMMGLGGALMEKFIVDHGVVFTDRMARYRVPSILHTPEIVAFTVEHPTTQGPYGAKGVGEIAGIPTAPAIINAIYNAVGVRVDSLPAEPELVWKSLIEK